MSLNAAFELKTALANGVEVTLSGASYSLASSLEGASLCVVGVNGALPKGQKVGNKNPLIKGLEVQAPRL